MPPLPTAVRPDLGTPVNTNKALDLKLHIRRPQLTVGVPPEIIVVYVCLAGSGRPRLHSRRPSLPKIRSRDYLKQQQ